LEEQYHDKFVYFAFTPPSRWESTWTALLSRYFIFPCGKSLLFC
jgi:hypothetical protein